MLFKIHPYLFLSIIFICKITCSGQAGNTLFVSDDVQITNKEQIHITPTKVEDKGHSKIFIAKNTVFSDKNNQIHGEIVTYKHLQFTQIEKLVSANQSKLDKKATDKLNKHELLTGKNLLKPYDPFTYPYFLSLYYQNKTSVITRSHQFKKTHNTFNYYNKSPSTDLYSFSNKKTHNKRLAEDPTNTYSIYLTYCRTSIPPPFHLTHSASQRLLLS